MGEKERRDDDNDDDDDCGGGGGGGNWTWPVFHAAVEHVGLGRAQWFLLIMCGWANASDAICLYSVCFYVCLFIFLCVIV